MDSCYVYAQKVGAKSLHCKPYQFYNSAREDKSVEERVTALVDRLQKSEAYSCIVVSRYLGLSLKDRIYEWHMDAEKLAERLAEHEEYERKRKELKAQIAALEAQVAELDKEWN
jgi:cell division protein FtsB